MKRSPRETVVATDGAAIDAAAKATGRTVSTRAPSSIEVYKEDFGGQSPAPDWLQLLRRQGMARFEALGFPTTKNEDWHFTSAAPIAERTFRLATLETQLAGPDSTNRREVSRRKGDSLNSARINRADLDGFNFGESWYTLVFVNGAFSEELSNHTGLGDQVRVSSLAHAIETGTPIIERELGKIAQFEQHTFTALNTAFISDGAFIELKNDAVVEQPIHLLFVSDGEGVSHPRNLVVAGRHSRAVIIESYVSVRDSNYFTNAVTEIVVGEGAHVDHYKIQRESESAFHVGTVQIREERNSQLHSFSFAVGGALARTNVYTSLVGDAATCTLNGLYLTDGNQHIDNQTSIEHIAPNCPSHEVYKGVLDGRSHGVFNGKVYVHPEAQKTDGKQSNNNLLLSPTARVDTKPQLEIFADDVKCTHGATVGRLDELAMFYLNSRGIGRETARTLLTYAFAADVLETIELESLKKQLEKMVLLRFAGDKAE
ncbi:MAG TPA: Fe-S cluster assembly protein SufD [Gemmatimonadaceae bacterium]|nr:Fe-S cluster assembly protein SufD [Gemmatimonadaceae bacterium]